MNQPHTGALRRRYSFSVVIGAERPVDNAADLFDTLIVVSTSL
jgi:hypothetical protein